MRLARLAGPTELRANHSRVLLVPSMAVAIICGTLLRPRFAAPVRLN